MKRSHVSRAGCGNSIVSSLVILLGVVSGHAGAIDASPAAAFEWQTARAHAGHVHLRQLRRTDESPVTVNDGRLTARIQLRDNHTPAGLRNLTFERIP